MPVIIRTPSHYTTQHDTGNYKLYNILFRYGADVHSRGNNDSTPSRHASRIGNFSVAQALRGFPESINFRNTQVSTPIRHASQRGHDMITRDRGGSSRTPLHLALLGGHRDVARLLVDHGADPDVRDSVGQTPFSIASDEGHRKLAQFLSGADVEGHNER
jgi:ankyrin repeat protein